MKYAVEMGSDAMMCISSFMKIVSGMQKWIRGGDTQDRDRISLL
jgi:hypothetical protein